MAGAGVSDSGTAKLYRLALTAADFAALRHIGRMHGHKISSALRFSLSQQAVRDAVYGTAAETRPESRRAAAMAAWLVSTPDDAGYYAACDAARASVYVDPDDPVALKQWSIRLYDTHNDTVEAIVRRWDLDSRARAFRFAVRVQAAVDGFKPPGGVWK